MKPGAHAAKSLTASRFDAVACEAQRTAAAGLHVRLPDPEMLLVLRSQPEIELRSRSAKTMLWRLSSSLAVLLLFDQTSSCYTAYASL
jgi:hypothetical protein